MATFPSLQTLTLDLPPSCIQFCPSHPDLFVVGTYFLHGKEHGTVDDALTPQQEGPQKRTGSLVLFRLDHENNEITHLSTIPTDFAVLDIQWSPRDPLLLAVAASIGLLAFYRLDAEGLGLVPSHVETISDSATLVLSLTWHPTRPHVLGLTLSNGKVCLCDCSNKDGGQMRVSDIHSHELEAWIMAFGSNPNPGSEEIGEVVLSGGDDIVLQSSNINSISEQGVPAWKDRKLHQAGITYILPLSDTLYLTGSYDDHIRLLSLPTIGRRTVLTELDLGGGVWRLKLLSSQDQTALPKQYTILASCMHAGARLLRLTEHLHNDDREFWNFEILGKFEEHQSMNYGSDVQPLLCPSSAGGSRAIVSTSFYDKRMCLWKVDDG